MLLLISGHLAIVAMNQVGSILFMISALAAFTRQATGSPVNVDVARRP